ncbi:MAG: VTT domain-containing protein [Sandaracinaceae bacterium]|nr:VTT domain-containing protein [Sandaracinaceae bacterium]
MPTSEWFTRARVVAGAKFLALAGLVTAVPVLAFSNPNVQLWVFAQADSMRSSGLVGITIYLGVCAIAGALVLPFWIPGVVAGFIFGFPNGGAIGFVGSVVSASTAFAVGRTFLRQRVARKLAENMRWQKVEHAIRRAPRKIVFLLRSLPILPQNFLGYALATTPVSFIDYLIGTMGLLPLVLAYAYVGSLARNVNELFHATSNRWLFGGIGVMTLLVLTVSARFAARVLKTIVAEEEV